MSRRGPFFLSVVLIVSSLVGTAPALAQAPAPAPVDSKELPLPATPAVPSLSVAPTAPPQASGPAETSPAAPPATAQTPPATQAEAGKPSLLAPPPADPSVPDQVTLASKPAVVLKGQSSWDEGYEKLRAAFGKLESEAKKAGLVVNGRPVTLFVDTDDQGFRYEAVLPVESLPSQKPAGLPPEIRLGATPEGKAIRFVHQAAYDDIDSTYEAITAYLDLKGIEVKDTLIEEYVEFGKDASDGAIEINIYVQPRK